MANYLVAEIGEEGVVRVTSPGVKPGDQVRILAEAPIEDNTNKGKWSQIKAALSETKSLDFPRRAYLEIIRDLHEIRG